jgi:uncharacterized protein YmfQ (DUF2313 family)
MSRSAYGVAYTALEDLYEIQDAFNELNAMFTVMLKHFHPDTTANAFAQLGMATVEHWSSTVAQWAECMDNELDSLPSEADSYSEKWKRLVALRDAAKAGDTR